MFVIFGSRSGAPYEKIDESADQAAADRVVESTARMALEKEKSREKESFCMR